MLFKNYEYFLAIAEAGSVSKAAEQLYISQPSLSKYLKRLEDNIGAELFSRDSYPLRLTEAGSLYLNHVSDIVHKEKRLEKDLAELRGPDVGAVSIGITVWRSSILLPVVLPRFRNDYPRIEVNVLEGSHQYMGSLLEHNKVDFSIIHLPNSYSNVTFEHLWYEKILFCAADTHPLLREQPVKRQEASPACHMDNDMFMRFSAEPFILLRQGQNIRDITQNFLNKLKVKPKIALETSNIVTAMNTAKSGLGVTFVPEAALQIPEQVKGLTFFTVDTPPLMWEVGFAYKTGASLSRYARLLVECIRNSMQEHE